MGEKRKASIEKYGYSHRNAVHALRLLRAGIIFFQTNFFPVNIVNEDKQFGQIIKQVKIKPETFNKSEINILCKEQEQILDNSFENRDKDYKFNAEKANELIYEAYMPILQQSCYLLQ